MPRRRHAAIARLLRAAEAATRRLVTVHAQALGAPVEPGPMVHDAPAGPRKGGAARSRGPRPFALADRRRAHATPEGFVAPVPGPPEAPVPTAGLVARIAALEAALEDMDAQVARMRRWHARLRRRWTTALRGGWPPGRVARSRHPVHAVLRETERLARSVAAGQGRGPPAASPAAA